MKNYKVGDRIIQWCFGDSRNERVVTVTAKYDNVKNGRPGFDGYTPDGSTVWGYDTDVHAVVG